MVSSGGSPTTSALAGRLAEPPIPDPATAAPAAAAVKARSQMAGASMSLPHSALSQSKSTAGAAASHVAVPFNGGSFE